MDNDLNAKNKSRSPRTKQGKGDGKSNALQHRDAGSESGDNEYKSQRTNRADSQESDAIPNEGNSTIGKILKRLEVLEEAFNCYVGSHRQRLEARLDENKQFVDKFSLEMKLLKEEVQSLTDEESQLT